MNENNESASRAMLPVTDSDVIEKSASAIESYGNSELAAKLRALATPVAGWVSVEEVAQVLIGRSDSAYCSYITQCQQTECLGVDYKISKGQFGAKELAAHKKAAHFLGSHKALADAATAIRAKYAAPPAPVTPKQEQSNG